MASNKKTVLPAAKALPKDALNALVYLCEKTSQAEAARKLGVSEGSISNALKGRYIGNVDRMAERIRGELLSETVICPGGYGEITKRICQDTREAPLWQFQNPYQRALRMHCNKCKHNPKANKP